MYTIYTHEEFARINLRKTSKNKEKVGIIIARLENTIIIMSAPSKRTNFVYCNFFTHIIVKG